MNKVKYTHNMDIEEVWRHAHHKMLEVDKEDLEELLLYVFNLGIEEGWDLAMDADSIQIGEVKFDPIP